MFFYLDKYSVKIYDLYMFLAVSPKSQPRLSQFDKLH